uniref:RWP-RK domain-containing protein n=1 Tax=Kalanchoe fedtschenkoi TaxID=63787 RepID=A0A7N0U2G1_KALFE
MKREPLSPKLNSYPSNVAAPIADRYNADHHCMVFDPSTQYQTWKNGPKLEYDPHTSHDAHFYLSEDEMTYLNQLFKTDPVEPLECTGRKLGNVSADGTMRRDMKEARKPQAGTRKRVSRFTKSSTLELEEIQKYFDMPITLAAKKMNVGLTVLKKRCRDLNIMRWPHRKIKSLKSLISNVKELGLEKEIQMLEEHRMTVEKMPHVELTEKTKKLRQACFKANYKKRRQVQASRCFSLIK